MNIKQAADVVLSGGSTTVVGPRCISVTLVTRSGEILVGAALRSVAQAVDACLLVYSSSIASPDQTLRAAAQAVGDKLIVQEIQAGQSLAAMLDTSLHWARQLGAGWALLLGQDQQLKTPAKFNATQEVMRAAGAGVSQVNCFQTHLDYAQVRCTLIMPTTLSCSVKPSDNIRPHSNWCSWQSNSPPYAQL
jgi:hypothetical protein